MIGRVETFTLSVRAWLGVCVLAAVLTSGRPAAGQCTPGWEPGFPLTGAHNGDEWVILHMLTSGEALFCGVGSPVGGFEANGVARYHGPSNTWLPAGVKLSVGVVDIVTIAGGEVVVVGLALDTSMTRRARVLRADPTIGRWTPIGGLINGQFSGVVLDAAGDVVVYGTFSEIDGVPAANIARYSLASGIWSAMDGGTDGRVSRAILLPGGDLVVSGEFQTAGGRPASRIARWSRATGRWLAIGAGLDAEPTALRLLPKGDLLVSGQLTGSGAVSSPGLIRLQTVTNTWMSVGGATGWWPNVWVVHPLSDGDALVAGDFTRVGGVAGTQGLARYRPSTNTWTSVNGGASNTVRFIVPLPGGDLLVGGIFNTIGGVTSRALARFRPSTNEWTAIQGAVGNAGVAGVLPNGDVAIRGFRLAGDSRRSYGRFEHATNRLRLLGVGMDLGINDAAALPNGDVIVGGDFSQIANEPAQFVARYTPSTRTYSALGAGVNGSVSCVVGSPNGDAWFFGSFTAAGGQPAGGMARYRFSAGTWQPLFPTPVDGAAAGVIRDAAALPNGELVIVGRFTSIRGIAAMNVAKYNPTTFVWSPLGAGVPVSGGLSGVVVGGDGTIFVHGSDPSSQARALLARYDAASASWVRITLPPQYDAVDAVAETASGQLVIAASDWLRDPIRRQWLLVYAPTTSTWIGPQVEMAGVVSLTPLPDGDVLLAGGEMSVPGGPKTALARFRPTNGAISSVRNAVVESTVQRAVVLPNSDIVIVGSFGSVDGNVSANFAHFRGGAICRTDFNCDRTIGPSDVFAFLNAYFARSADADYSGDRQITPSDIFGFLSAYFAREC